jgi:hypothetical protein
MSQNYGLKIGFGKGPALTAASPLFPGQRAAERRTWAG